jgi:2-polyprenyl-6-methoxyphenol hydroxylase-like FAD-dependent oxidoreductase
MTVQEGVMNHHLSDGSRVCIVGGGPAGSFAALHLLHQAHRQGLRLEVSIFEPRDFTRPGPSGCNRCAGILSSHLLEGLAGIGLDIPPALIQADVTSYAVHLLGETVQVQRPSARHRILSVYRGGGPRVYHGTPQASFDAYLLAQARERGATIIAARVKRITWEDGPVVHTAEAQYPAALLVLAIGVNSRSPLADEFGYIPPVTETMAQNEVLRPPAWPADEVSVYFAEQPGVLFGALIPKGGYLNVSLLGQKLQLEAVQEFIDTRFDMDRGPAQGERASSHVHVALPDIGPTAAPEARPAGAIHTPTLCGCTPRIAVGPARRFYGERWVAVGDASVVRLYKDGIGSAFYTAQQAMTTAVASGISAAAFARDYAPFCRSVAGDNRYGQMLLRLWDLTLRTPHLLHAWVHAIQAEAALPPEQRIHQRILWGMFTGEETYRTLFWLAVSPRAMTEVLRAWRR